MLQIVINVLV